MANESTISELIVKQMRQDLTGQEAKELERWLDEAPSNQRFLREMTEEEELLTGLKVLEEMDRVAINHKIEYYRKLERKAQRPGIIRRIVYGVLSAAVITALFWGAYLLKGGGQEKTAQAYHSTTVTVPYGKRQQVVLPDSTEVTLNTGSRLTYPVAFDQDKRVVEVEGEAYFVVKKDVQHPFLVRSGRLEIQVLGTSFSVRDYPGENLQRAILEEGKITVRTQKGSVTVKPGDEVQVDSAEGSIRVLPVKDPHNMNAWKQGYFNFDNIDVRAAVAQLAQWYHKKVYFTNDLKKGGTLGEGNIQQDLPLETLLTDLELPDVHFHLKNDTIFVTK